MKLLEKGMKNLAEIVRKISGKDPKEVTGGGAAGGIPAILSSLLKADVVQGAEFLAEKAGLRKALEKAELLITGEGKVDRTTLEGKVPFVACKFAREYNVKTILVGGAVEVFDDLFEIADIVFPTVTFPLKADEVKKMAEVNLFKAVKASLLIFKNLWGGAQ